MHTTEKNNTTLKCIWFALFAAIFIYFLILYLGPAGQNYNVSDVSFTESSFLKIFIFIAAIILIAGYLISKKFASGITNQDYCVPFIVKWASADAIAILGLVVSMKLENLSAFQPFVIIALMVMTNSFPYKNQSH